MSTNITDIIKYNILPKDCTGCGICAQTCNHNAISWEFQPNNSFGWNINQDLCVLCGSCFTACSSQAIQQFIYGRPSLVK
ncbi:MAG: 4Fe-4S binding protein [Rickettsiales bacterium]|nr:4Fe-4S binding protein [Rickettsiales bacterium]